MAQLIIILSGLMVIAGVIILTGHLNRRKRERKRLATLKKASPEQLKLFVKYNIGKFAYGINGCCGYICGCINNDVVLGLNNDSGWVCHKALSYKILKKYESYTFSGVFSDLSLIKITEKP